jgi:hypothetical protein
LITETQILQPLGEVKDVVIHAELIRRTSGHFLEGDAVAQKLVRVVFHLRDRKLQHDSGLLVRGVMRHGEYSQHELERA